jgi:hypothetical protein
MKPGLFIDPEANRLTGEQLADAKKLIEQDEISLESVAKALDMPRATFIRRLANSGYCVRRRLEPITPVPIGKPREGGKS